MLEAAPDYYKEFRCIAGECRHSCCIGWEIDIDPEMADDYRHLPGKLGERLRRCIDWEGTPHFILGEGERCPFLNGENLCDIILELGEEHICGICSNHPRFYNELPGRLEMGLGLCCEEAARLVISRKDPVTLEIQGERETEDELVDLRDDVIAMLQDRSKTISQRLYDVLELFGASLPDWTLGEWAKRLMELERLTEDWTVLLTRLRDGWNSADFSGFDRYMETRQTEYEQLLVYLIYRHMASSFDQWEAAARICFAAFGYLLLRGMGAVLWTESKQFSPEQQLELVRLFSSELEYSQENLDTILDILYEEIEESCFGENV